MVQKLKKKGGGEGSKKGKQNKSNYWFLQFHDFWIHSPGEADTRYVHIFGCMKQPTKLQSAGHSHSCSEKQNHLLHFLQKKWHQWIAQLVLMSLK